jgi:glycerol-3-phosphate acyltransferase PlsY
LTLLFDALKGSTAVALVASFSGPMEASKPYGMMSLAALLAVVGHIFPIWLKFRGGKGVATGLGSFLMIAPKAVLLAAGIFLVVVLLFRYVSLGSIASVASFPVLARLLHEYGNSWMALAFMSMASLVIVAKHHPNIRRLLDGTENRFGSKPVARTERQ